MSKQNALFFGSLKLF